MSLRTRLLLIFLPALLGLVYFAGRGAIELAQERNELRQLADETGFALTVGALVHELQIERGLSAGFIAGRGARFKDPLARQRQATDGARHSYLKDRDARVQAQGSGTLASAVGAADNAITALDVARRGIDAQALPGKDPFAFHSDTIDRLLTIVGGAAAHSAVALEDATVLAFA